MKFNMYSKLLLGLSAIALVAFGCNEDNLNVSPADITEANYFNTESDFDRGVIGAYAKLTDFYWYNGNNQMHEFWQLPGDDVTTTALSPYEIFSTLNASSPQIDRYYTQAYQMISRTNIVLEKLDEEDGVYTTPDLKNHHRGEVLFLRGWMNFQLWNYYGTAPVITRRLELGEEVNFPNSSGTELLEQAITDLRQAAELLPESWPTSLRGRVTNDAANGMLGKALVFLGTVNNDQSAFTQALAAFDGVDNTSLVEDYGDNFSAFTENNAESLFEFQASQAASDNVWLPNDFSSNDVGSTSAYWGLFDNHWSLFGKPRFTATSKFINAVDSQDPRIVDLVDPATGHILKYVRNNAFTNTGVGSANNPRILRYADVLLLEAEAIVQSGGNLQDALDLVNRVRERANDMNPDTDVPASYNLGNLDDDDVLDLIFEERFVELFAEGGHRWLDLRRRHLGGQIDLSMVNFSSARSDFNIDIPKNLYYPIPQSELDLNPNATQNVGY